MLPSAEKEPFKIRMISESQMKSTPKKGRNLWIIVILPASIFFSEIDPIASWN